jgi:hypothetical protein
MVLGHPSSSALSTPPITSSRISTQRGGGPPPSARKSGAGEARRRVGRRRGRLPSSDRQSLHALVMQSSAPAPGAPSPWDSMLGAIEDSISLCTFLQMTYTDENPHADGNAMPGARPRFRPPRRRDPHVTSPAPSMGRGAGVRLSLSLSRCHHITDASGVVRCYDVIQSYINHT